MINLILCGGSGSRLWPLSRTLMPKQFIKLFDNLSLFQLTVKRNMAVCDSTYLVTNTDQYFIADEQYNELTSTGYKYILEGVGRNTAPAITLSALTLDPKEIILVTPSDHLIKDKQQYYHALKQAKALAKEGNLVTFGITPTYPETGYGYIKSEGNDVLGFFEKPSLDIATNYVKEGCYAWNSGMFCFQANVFLTEIKKYAPEIYSSCIHALAQKEGHTITKELMCGIPEDSIDCAVMEKSSKVKMVHLDAGWNDVGSFESLSKEFVNDEHNNLIISDKSVQTIDVKDSIIIDSGDALLIAPKSSAQKVKDVVTKLKNSNPEIVNTGLTGYRPWGSYTILDENEGYKVKRIEVSPHKRISLQSHKHRNEHWVVIKGIATITLNDKTFKLAENESTFIRIGDHHRLANDTDERLIIIESQVGSYTGEDDITRYEDDFYRD